MIVDDSMIYKTLDVFIVLNWTSYHIEWIQEINTIVMRLDMHVVSILTCVIALYLHINLSYRTMLAN